jgi:aarF domain-containing kinase
MNQSSDANSKAHPANVLWRKSQNGKPQLILLDHGLYKQIDDDFRLNYATLWKSLLMADIDKIKTSCSRLGIDEMVSKKKHVNALEKKL